MDKIERGPKEVFDTEIQKDLLVLEEQEVRIKFNFGDNVNIEVWIWWCWCVKCIIIKDNLFNSFVTVYKFPGLLATLSVRIRIHKLYSLQKSKSPHHHHQKKEVSCVSHETASDSEASVLDFMEYSFVITPFSLGAQFMQPCATFKQKSLVNYLCHYSHVHNDLEKNTHFFS